MRRTPALKSPEKPPPRWPRQHPFQAEDHAYAQNLLTHAKALFDFADLCRGIYTDAIPSARPIMIHAQVTMTNSPGVPSGCTRRLAKPITYKRQKRFLPNILPMLQCAGRIPGMTNAMAPLSFSPN
jgi:hypothetical protein